MQAVTIARLLAAAAIAAGLFMAGWTVNGWRKDAEISDINEKAAAATTKASEDARVREQTLQHAIADIDAARTEERTKADEEINRLRARVDAGAVRLRVQAKCPAPEMPGPADGAGVDTGTGAELSADARSDYFALRAGLVRQSAKLSACQAALSRIVKGAQ